MTTCYADWEVTDCSPQTEREMSLTEAGGCQYSREVPNVKKSRSFSLPHTIMILLWQKKNKKLLTGKLFIFTLWINKVNRNGSQSTNLGSICPFNHQILTEAATHCISTRDSWDSCKLDQLPISGCAWFPRAICLLTDSFASYQGPQYKACLSPLVPW